MNGYRMVAAAAGFAALMGNPAAALAALIGDEIDVELVATATYTDNGVLVDGNVEIDGASTATNIGTFLEDGEFIDFDDTSLSFSFGDLGGQFEITVSGIDATLTGVSVGAFSSYDATASLTAPFGPFDANSFAFLLVYGVGTAGQTTSGRIDLTFADDGGDNGDVSAVPLPASALLLLTGFAGLGAARLRRKR